MNNAIEVENLTKHYDKFLEDVFLEITGGQVGAVTNETQENNPRRRGMGGRK
jgi:hypothetical protein